MLISDVLLAAEEMNWVAPELREVVKDIPDALSLDLRIHITRANGLVPALRNSTEKTEEIIDSPIKSTITEKDADVSSMVEVDEEFKICLGRPDLATLVKEEVECAIGPVSVNGVLLFLHTWSLH